MDDPAVKGRPDGGVAVGGFDLFYGLAVTRQLRLGGLEGRLGPIQLRRGGDAPLSQFLPALIKWRGPLPGRPGTAAVPQRFLWDDVLAPISGSMAVSARRG